MTSHISKRKTGFRLPPDVSYEKQRLPDAWAYVFRHRVLGELGRILLQELDDRRCHISCEVVGDPSDPMTTQRTAIFKPLGLELTRQMEAAFGTTPEDSGPLDPPPRPLEGKEVIESKIIPCERCGAIVNNASVLGLRPSSGFLFTVRTSHRSHKIDGAGVRRQGGPRQCHSPRYR